MNLVRHLPKPEDVSAFSRELQEWQAAVQSMDTMSSSDSFKQAVSKFTDSTAKLRDGMSAGAFTELLPELQRKLLASLAEEEDGSKELEQSDKIIGQLELLASSSAADSFERRFVEAARFWQKLIDMMEAYGNGSLDKWRVDDSESAAIRPEVKRALAAVKTWGDMLESPYLESKSHLWDVILQNDHMEKAKMDSYRLHYDAAINCVFENQSKIAT